MVPLVVIIAVGTKLQAIITQMAVEIQERHAVVQGIPLVQVSDKHFWFSWPKLVLHLIHLTLFQFEFGLRSCFHKNFKLQILRVIVGIGTQFLCSYITLPLYALVTQPSFLQRCLRYKVQAKHKRRLRSGNVVFNYRYFNNKLQRTEVTEDFSCPFCLAKCASFKKIV
ncbi:MLO-like protein 5 isoform X2 [Impatiens glandulifera]|uniref:MLO-like protein 5 isoform X2 n=1 Tax=Impatiens glandulifera TaxID=253017 RepID=UPI001FB12687|nr:MLO-like protein 5 isoform X2 [Impatiens glandulifera]XP_047314710.1 MLO-like protein 5 isoform X2 [Impatiens glandulifera]XP_047314711.1 MLO-like protein 5 isoform X2 [Impatiens glandulifera]XP_047314712.1 MLO-like protein 5 isoform X2 [Impatiens glandulifera]XP_047314713.1 MLO-like protein 5 isoform X2 [Impatiens glandulifera]XP_047314715.1 MLO-like protein 5 isoform X2 [Impatiens glandulifera]